MSRIFLTSVQRIVIKLGTAALTRNEALNMDFLTDIAGQIHALRKNCPDTVLVTSGAIGLGKQELGIPGPVKNIRVRQACASVGQPLLMRAYKQVFEKFNIKIAQVLLTRSVFNDRKLYLNIRNSVETLLSLSVLPVMNENDSVSTQEIGETFGDNDTLSALVASKLGAELLCILSDVDNLYTKNPHLYKDAQPVSYVPSVSPEIRRGAGNPGKLGTGGMRSKLDAAEIAASSGCYTVIANARQKNVLQRIVNGEEIGTLFEPGKRLQSRTRWILHSAVSGNITIDSGAMDALHENKNLLISGVAAVQGSFEAGSVVTLNNRAKAISLFSSTELAELLGKHSSEVEKIAGKGRRVLARSNDIVFTD